MNWYNRYIKIAGRPKRVWPVEELNKIKSLLEEGKSIRQISRFFGTNPSSIRALNKKYQLVDLEKVKREKDEWIANLYLLPPDGKGISGKELKMQYNISKETIFKALERLGLESKYRGRFDDYVTQQMVQKTKDFLKNNPGANEENSRRVSEWWKQFGEEPGEKLTNRLLFYPTRQQAINHLKGFAGRLSNDVSRANASAVYNKYIDIINNHTYPDEVQQGVQNNY